MQQKTIWKNWRFYAIALLIIGIVCEGILFTAVVVNTKRKNNPVPGDVIIVLGARVSEDGRPTPALARRLDLALSLYNEGYAGAIITTGARGSDEPVEEAFAMRDYLLEKGVPEAAILPEPGSFSTQENLENAKAIMAENGMETAIIVTSDYHVWRALSMAERLGIKATGAGSLNALTWPVALKNYARESLSWIKYVVTR